MLVNRIIKRATQIDNPILFLKERTTQHEKVAKERVMPTWAATKSQLMTHSESAQSYVNTNTEVISPLFKTSPTDYATLHTVLRLTQGISAYVVGLERKTIITLDLDLFSHFLKIQQTVGNSNWILRAGALHIAFAALHALGKTIDGSGIDTCAVESGTYTAAALRGIYGGKSYKRGVEYHITTSQAIMMMKFEAICSELLFGPLQTQCLSFKKSLHEQSPEMVEIFESIQSWYAGNIKPEEDRKEHGELCFIFVAIS